LIEDGKYLKFGIVFTINLHFYQVMCYLLHTDQSIFFQSCDVK